MAPCCSKSWGLPGSELGRLLEHLRYERAFGRIEGRTAALAEANRWLSHRGGAL